MISFVLSPICSIFADRIKNQTLFKQYNIMASTPDFKYAPMFQMGEETLLNTVCSPRKA